MPTRKLSPEGEHTWDGVPARTLGCERCELGDPHRLEKETSVSEDVGPKGGWIVRSHIGSGGEQNIFTRVLRPFPRRDILKTLRGSVKGKTKEDNICLWWTWVITCSFVRAIIDIENNIDCCTFSISNSILFVPQL